jgi:autotransporter passenger strand-loop-strand repeat protein
MTTYTVSSGQSISGITVQEPDSLIVSSGGTAVDAVLQGGFMEVLAGGQASGTTVSDSGEEEVVSGGSASGTNVGSGGTEWVGAGGSASFTTVSSGGEEEVGPGGSASDAIVNSGGIEYVFGTASGTVVSGGGTEYVWSGGSAGDTTVDSGGEAAVYGTASGTTVDSGGTLIVEIGGTVSGLTLNSDGNVYYASAYVVSSGQSSSGITLRPGDTETVLSGGTSIATIVNGGVDYVSGVASGTIVSNGGTENVDGGGSASGTTVSNGGTENVVSGGSASFTIVSSGGVETVLGSGSANSTVVASAGEQDAYGTTSGTAVSSGGYELVWSDGTASATMVGSGGYLVVLPGRTESGAVVQSGGAIVSTGIVLVEPNAGISVWSSVASDLAVSSGDTEFVLPGGAASFSIVSGASYEEIWGAASFTNVSMGGDEEVESGGTASGAVVNSGGEEDVSAAGTASFTTLNDGGREAVFSGGTASGTVVNSGGYESVAGGVSIASTVSGGGEEYVFEGTASGIVLSAGGTAELGANALAGGVITFAGSGATLKIDGTVMPAATISGFAASDTIDLIGVPYGSGGQASLLAGNALQVVANGTTVDIQLDPTATYSSAFLVFPDSGTGTAVTYACYRAGTLIRTDHGEERIEALRVGDRVVSAFGRTVPVTWLGYRRVDCRRHPKPWDVWPVRIAAGAFGANQPRRDLFLSPDHAVFFGGVLIPVRYLINDATIVQEAVDVVSYWHVELPEHGVLLAEGLPAESYLDTGNRGAFANGGGNTMLHPDFALRVWETEGCARLVRAGAELVAIRNVLFDCAAALGHLRTRDAGLHVVANGRIVRPEVTGPLHRFRLGRMACAVRLVSLSAVPASVRADSDDHRRLGVAVSRIVLDGRTIPLADARLGFGWHALEADRVGGFWRWTDGDAALDVAGACAGGRSRHDRALLAGRRASQRTRRLGKARALPLDLPCSSSGTRPRVLLICPRQGRGWQAGSLFERHPAVPERARSLVLRLCPRDAQILQHAVVEIPQPLAHPPDLVRPLDGPPDAHRQGTKTGQRPRHRTGDRPDQTDRRHRCVLLGRNTMHASSYQEINKANELT